MSKFTTLDLGPYFNTIADLKGWHPEVRQNLKTLPIGPQSFWGIPFGLGGADGRAWVVLEPDGSAVEFRLSGTATYLIFAHFCDESRGPEEPTGMANWDVGVTLRPGERLADYALVYADGYEHRQPIRRRFEVGNAMGWQRAFAARPHIQDRSQDWRGPYPAREWGKYQTSVSGTDLGLLQYWIYALENPHPDRTLAAIRLEPMGTDRLAVAGLTLYHGREHPLRHRRLESLRVTLPSPVTPDEVRAEIDQGIIARCYAVPAFHPKRWLEAETTGWGEEETLEQATTQVVLDIVANPEATLSVCDHPVDLRDLWEKGESQSQDGKARIEVLTPQKVWVHGVVLDESTGRPTPARVHFRSPDGRYFPPYGHRHEVNDDWFADYGGDLKLGSTQYAYVDGRFQAELPVGDVYVEVVKGFEYQPVRQCLTIQPGQRELTLRIGRALDWRRKGWMTADTHVHFLSPQTAWLEAQAEGVNLVNLLATQWGDLFTNVMDITGDLSGASRDDTLVWVGTENRQHMLGHISLLGVKGAPVFPMCAGGASESYLGDPVWTSMAEWADTCREREGLVVLPHFPNPHGEVTADIVLGKIDAVEIRYFTPELDCNRWEWYRFLNCGYRVAAVGGTDKMSAGMPVGGVRTYARIGDTELSFANWARAVRAGRTFTTSGPLIDLMVEGRFPGDEIQLPADGGTLEVEAWIQSLQPFHELQILVNGQVVAHEAAEDGAREARLRSRVRLERSSWIAARCISRVKVWHCWPIHIAAHTSPVYVKCGSEEMFNPSDAVYMLTLIEGGLTWLDTLATPADPGSHARIRGVFEAAHSSLGRRLAAHAHVQRPG